MPPRVEAAKFKLPTIQYPQLKGILKRMDYVCSNCSSLEGQPIWRTLEHKEGQSWIDPISAPSDCPPFAKLSGGVGEPAIPYATRVAAHCWSCMTPPADSDHPGATPGGLFDVLAFANAWEQGYRPPRRPSPATSRNESLEEDDPAPTFEKITRKKKLVPKSKQAKQLKA